MRPRLLASLALAVAAVAPCAAAPLRIVSLHTVLTEIVTEVGGADVEVVPLMRAGVDPHVFEPSPADVRQTIRADLVVAAGLKLEVYLPRLARDLPPGRLLAVGDKLPNPLVGVCRHPSHRHAPGDTAHDELDPHWWHGIAETKAAVDIVRDALVRLRPNARDGFVARAAAYQARLDTLAAWSRETLAGIAPGQRLLVTTHDAFGYLAREHQLTVLPILGTDSTAEADARHLVSLIDTLKRRRIRTVFAEGTVNGGLIETVARETGARRGASLLAEGLGTTPATQSYEGMMRHNVEAIASGLR
jgi:zinc/manganese transport system substrate-binding protein